MSTCYVYVLLCSNGALYTGISKNPKARFEVHKKGRGALFTRMHTPTRILATVPYVDRAEAMRQERKIKRLSHDEKWTWIADRAGAS